MPAPTIEPTPMKAAWRTDSDRLTSGVDSELGAASSWSTIVLNPSDMPRCRGDRWSRSSFEPGTPAVEATPPQRVNGEGR
jgi:hypothetical protein